jgi:uncharacterized protein YndB with AHSA1/START domain/protein-S-isoprenylcysteine O-methyltransferase Ste14
MEDPMTKTVYHVALAAFALLALPAYLALARRSAGYGRHAAPTGAGLPSRVAWICMELPSAISFALVSGGPPRRWPLGALLWGLWMLHYLHRGLIYPLRIRSARRVPVWIVAAAFAFTSINGALNALGLGGAGPALGRASLGHPRAVLGVVLFLVGMGINLDSDTRLLRTPRTTKGGYGIVRGGLFRWVSCPNYLGEIVEWLGFAIASGSAAALVFFVWTLANLVPRARAHHAWCLRHLPGYPRERRALWPALLALGLSGCASHASVRAEITIAAPPEVVWDVLTDLLAYPAWNPFTTRVDGRLELDNELVLHVALPPGKKMRRSRQRVLAIVPDHCIVWGTQLGGRSVLRTRRAQRLTPTADGGTRYQSTDTFRGGLTPLVMSLYRRDLERGFAAMASALKTRAEAAARERAPRPPGLREGTSVPQCEEP